MNTWDYYKIKRFFGAIKRRATGKYFKRYAGRKLYFKEQGNFLIKEKIESNKPFAICRFGSTELSVMLYREAILNNRKEKFNDKNLCTLSGFFPYDKGLIDDFSEMMIRIIEDVDVLGVWFSSLEEFIVEKYMKNTKVTYLKALEPYYFDEPWSKALKGKKVLVIHPFEDSISKQYSRHSELFQNKDILPDFELVTLKAVQTLAGEKDERFNNWFEALDYMVQEVKNIDFDIAIIGCGAYGMPLAIEIKRLGKQAIHIGGATQILFGIKGNRWDSIKDIAKMYNDYWIRPEESENLMNKNEVENGCYW